MNTFFASRAYKSVEVETGVGFADPHRLILMLYDGALAALGAARLHMQQKKVAPKCESISKAVQILQEGLVASLEVRPGDPLAQNLRELYDYMSRRLVLANLKNDPAILDEVSKLLSELRGAWAAIQPAAGAAR